MLGSKNPNFGKKMSEEQKKRISLSRKGIVPWNKGLTKEDPRVQKYAFNSGNFTTERISGANSYSWKGGITPKNQAIRTSTKYKQWRTAVFTRDDYTCQRCFIKGTKLHAHHIKTFSKYPDLRFKVSNGLTLCVPCHSMTDTYAAKFFRQPTNLSC